MNKDLSSDFGDIKIHRKVIVQVAGLAAHQVPGVKKVGLECYGLIGKILKLLRCNVVKVKTNAQKEVQVSVPIVVEYNVNAVDVAYEVQKNVTEKLLNTLNMDTLRVNIKIKKIEKKS